jgi:hypothetical protein
MHHVGMAEMSPSMAGQAVAVAEQHVSPMPESHDQQNSGMDHGMLHLCLAVLCTVIAVALALWLRRAVSSSTSLRTGRIRGAAASRPPPLRPGRDILTTFCVLRI